MSLTAKIKSNGRAKCGLNQSRHEVRLTRYSRRWKLNLLSLLPASDEGDAIMWSRLLCVAAISFGLVPKTAAGEQSGLVHRASCTVVRFYVAKYSASAAEAWARSHGATDAEIEAARRCLKDAPAQTAQAAQ